MNDHNMRMRLSHYLLLICVLCLVMASAHAQHQVLAISSYFADGSPYPTFGDELEAYLNDLFGHRYEFVNLESEGSVANLLNLLLRDDVYFAIVQEDVAHYFYTGESNEFFFSDRSDDMRITALTRLFPEEVYLLVRPDVESSHDINAIYVGESLSGTYATYTNYRKYHHPRWTEVQMGDRLQLFRDGEVDAIFEVSSTPSHEILDFAASTPCSVLPIRQTEVSLDLDLYRSTTIPDSLCPGGEATATVSVPALLLAKRTVPSEVAQAIIEAIFDETTRRRVFPGTWPYLEALEFTSEGGTPDLGDVHVARMPLPPHPAVVVSTLGRFPYLDFLLLAVGLFLLGFLAIRIPQMSWTFRRLLRSSVVRRLVHQAIVIVIAALLWAVFACWGIKFHEIQGLASGTTLIDSAFVHMNAVELLLWATIFSFTGYEDTLFPLMGIGKMLAVSIHLVGLGMITWLGAQVISHLVARIMSRRQEMDLTNKKGHVVVCNWNDQGPRLIEELRVEHVPQDRLDREIIVLVTDPVCPVPTESHDGVFHKEMNPWDLEAYKKVNLLEADSVIILSPVVDGEDGDADGIVLRTALAIRRFCTDRAGEMTPRRPHVLAQLRGSQEPHVIQEVGIDEFVCSGNLGARILAQAVISPGITEFFSEILTHDVDSNEVYSQKMPPDLCRGDANFWRVVEHYLDLECEDNPALPVGLRLRDRNKANGPVVTLLNPTKKSLVEHGVTSFREDDKVIVFADNSPA